MARALQEGIYHRKGARPGKFFGLLFLAVDEGCDARRAGARLADLWQLYRGLQEGRVPDLAPATVPHDDDALTVLVGFSHLAFELPGAARPLPAGLHEDNRFDSPQASGGGPVLHGSGLAYAPEVQTNPAAREFCVQVIADTKLAVDRAVVETWKRLADSADPETGLSDLRLTGFYLGLGRPDRRSWIDFHDGLSNMHTDEREGAIAIKPGPQPDEWCAGGTYLAFLRLAVDLVAWRELTRTQQELMVGRDKLTGCPLTAVDAEDRPVTDPGCPVAGTEIWETPNDPLFAEPPATSDPVVLASHVQRANHHQPADLQGGRRIFRQGYEFLEWQEAGPGFRAGLNFVSFQDTPARVAGMLTTGGWLGGVNFGGDPDAQPPGMQTLLSAYAAGVYLVPPAAEDGGLPGGSLLGI